MHEMAYNLIIGDQHAVDRLTKEALEQGFSANTVLDDGLISGMAIVRHQVPRQHHLRPPRCSSPPGR